ncbi:major capsid protein [Ferviditalea candida]|uniref:Major capsid protein n=1 Tax=Ferviditalea candida TaxID=3108399 RepID=A0ABU5ZKM7_9BACL|nr:major capsid protein [Paenibacillaceae bacterium T2]
MLNLDIYKTQTMLAAINLMKPVRTFLRSTFFPGMTTFVTEDVLLDFKKGKRKMAPFVAPRVGGIAVERQGFRTDKYTAPKIAPQRQITIDDIMKRGLGENVFSQRTPADRQTELLGRDLAELDDMITRREEWMVRELMFSGVINVKGYIDHNNSNYVDQVIDYGVTNVEALAGAALWSASTSTKLADLKRWRLQVIQTSGRAPSMVVFGQDAADAFLSDADVADKLKQFNSKQLEINPAVMPDGTTYLGRITDLALDLYTYDEWYVDDDGTEKPMVPTNKILLARPNSGELLYGAVTQMENGQFMTYEGPRVPKSWSDDENEHRMIRLSGRPVPKPEDVDSWFVATVL